MPSNSFKLPFNTFDFFGFVIPGSFFVFGVYFHDIFLFSKEGPLHNFYYSLLGQPDAKFNLSILNSVSFTFEVPRTTEVITPYSFSIIFFAGALMVYLAGHVVSAISSALLDRILVDRINFYPYVGLLESLFETDEISLFKRRCNKFLAFIFVAWNIFIILRYDFWFFTWLCIGVGSVVLVFKEFVNKAYKKQKDSIGSNLAPFYWQYPVYSRFRYSHDNDQNAPKGRRPSFSNMSDLWSGGKEEKPLHKKIIRLTVFLFNGVTILVSHFMRITFGSLLSLLRIGSPLPESFCKLFKEQFIRVYGSFSKDYGTNCFWLAASYVLNHMPAHAALAQRAYNLMSFNRNASISCFLLVWYGVLQDVLSRQTESHMFLSYMPGRYNAWIGTTLALALVLGLRYYNTYYNHYTKLILRGFVTPIEKSVVAD